MQSADDWCVDPCVWCVLQELEMELKKFGIYDDAKELLASADTNGDGHIDYLEFCGLLRNNNEALKQSTRAIKRQYSKFF